MQMQVEKETLQSRGGNTPLWKRQQGKLTLKRGWNYEGDEETGLGDDGGAKGTQMSTLILSSSVQFTEDKYLSKGLQHIKAMLHSSLGQEVNTTSQLKLTWNSYKVSPAGPKKTVKQISCSNLCSAPAICPTAGRTGYASTSSELPLFYCFLSQPSLCLMIF